MATVSYTRMADMTEADLRLVDEDHEEDQRKLPGRLMGGVGEHDVVEELGDPAVLAPVEGLAGPDDHRIGTRIDNGAGIVDGLDALDDQRTVPGGSQPGEIGDRRRWVEHPRGEFGDGAVEAV